MLRIVITVILPGKFPRNDSPLSVAELFTRTAVVRPSNANLTRATEIFSANRGASRAKQSDRLVMQDSVISPFLLENFGDLSPEEIDRASQQYAIYSQQLHWLSDAVRTAQQIERHQQPFGSGPLLN